MPNNSRWLTTREAAERACCDPGAIRQAVRARRLRATRTPQGKLKFLEDWVEDWLMDQVMSDAGEIDVAVDAAPSGARELSSW
jgi:hypothetical protein